jgi:hypothetical protein
MPPFTSENARTMGARGGRKTLQRHGCQHMRRIGLLGFWATVDRHWNGDARAYINYLIMLGLAATDPVPQNGAFLHDRDQIERAARSGRKNYLRADWIAPRRELHEPQADTEAWPDPRPDARPDGYERWYNRTRLAVARFNIGDPNGDIPW